MLFPIAKSLLCLALLASAGAVLRAQENPPIVINGTTQFAISTRPPLPVGPTETEPPAGLKKIFSNLGSKTDTYFDEDGVFITGPGFSRTQWIGIPFQPASSAKATQIKIALSYFGSGTNAATVSLNADSGGVPGTALQTWELTNLPLFGSCCTLQTLNSKTGIKLTNGTTYWLVAQTDSTNEDAEAIWYFTWNKNIGTQAYNVDNAGWQTQQTQLSAFAVFGR